VPAVSPVIVRQPENDQIATLQRHLRAGVSAKGQLWTSALQDILPVLRGYIGLATRTLAHESR
jgi:hypothetical protein